MSVPKAAMNKHDGPILRKDHVRTAWKTRGMQSVAEPMRKKAAADGDFGLGILAPDARHHSAPGLVVNDIHHVTKRSGWVISAVS